MRPCSCNRFADMFPKSKCTIGCVRRMACVRRCQVGAGVRGVVPRDRWGQLLPFPSQMFRCACAAPVAPTSGGAAGVSQCTHRGGAPTFTARLVRITSASHVFGDHAILGALYLWPAAEHCQARLAQSAERKALNLVVVGSSATVGSCVYARRALSAYEGTNRCDASGGAWPSRTLRRQVKSCARANSLLADT